MLRALFVKFADDGLFSCVRFRTALAINTVIHCLLASLWYNVDVIRNAIKQLSVTIICLCFKYYLCTQL